MKKFICILFLSVCLFSLGCSAPKGYNENISQIRNNVFYGAGQTYSVEVFAEQRENPFINDGVAGSKQNFIIVRVLNQNNPITVTATYSGDTYTQTTKYNPHAISMVAVIKVDSLPTQSLSVTVEYNGNSEQIECVSKLKSDTISPLKALNSVLDKEKTFIESIKQDGKLKAEIYIRLIAENDNNFYYVGFGLGSNKLTAFLLDGKTGEIIAGKS